MINKVKDFKYALLNIVYILFSLGFILTLFFSYNSHFDQFLTRINDPNQHNYYNGFVSPYVKVSKSKELVKEKGQRYTDLLNHFYYNSFSNGCREVIDNDVSAALDETINVKLVTQQTFQILNTKNSAGLYTVDMNMFYSYFSLDDVSDVMPYTYQVRNNCDTFVYISDTLAEKLVNHYKIVGTNNPFLELIKNDNYSVLPLRIGESQSTLKVCINAVLSSKHRFGPQIQKIYGDFAVVYCNSRALETLDEISFDIDLKVNQYGNKKNINDVKNLGYNTNNSYFEYYSYDYEIGKHFHNEILDADFLKLERNSFIPTFVSYIIFFVGCIFLIALSLVKVRVNKTRDKILLFLPVVLFIMYGFIANFINFYPYYSVCFIVFMAIIIVMNWKEAFGNGFISNKDTNRYEISI